MRARVAWAEGNEYGRIWRIHRKDRPANAALLRPSLTALATPKLVEQLGSANGWRRDTAQRLLLERKDPSARTPLHRIAHAASRPESRVQALYTLEVLAQLDSATLLAGLAAPHPRVRATSAQIAGRWLVQS